MQKTAQACLKMVFTKYVNESFIYLVSNNLQDLALNNQLWSICQPARTYIQQVREDTGCSAEDLPEAMNDREKWRERVRDIRASGMT